MPLHLQLLVKWEVVSPNRRYREFYHEIGNIEKFPFTYWLNRRWFLQIVDIHENIKTKLFQYFKFSSRFMLFPTLKKKLVYKINSGVWIFFF